MATYYDHLLLASMNDMSSRNFLDFVDAALLFDEKEQSFRLDLEKKGKSKFYTNTVSEEEEEEEEEERNKRFLYLFPRKPRTWVRKFVTRTRNPQQNLYEASSSSSSLLNTIPTVSEPRIPLQWPSPLYLSFLGKNPPNPNFRKRRRTGGLKNANLDLFSNPNSQSSSSSCVTENTNGKKQRKVTGGSKKAKVEFLSWKGREIPELLLRVTRDMKVADEPKLIFEREKLFATDVAPGQGRLSMPFNQLIRHDFLTPVEERILQQDISNGNKTGLEALLVNQRSEKWEVRLKRWETKGRSWNYCLISGWNDFVKSNGLQKDHGISVWSFRSSGLPCFALIPLPTMA